MKTLIFLLFLLAVTAAAARQSTRPIPRGVRDGEEAVYQGEKDIPAPKNQAARPNYQQVQREANQLAALAHDLPAEVSQLRKGNRPQDLDQKLKQIDKLSKHLRSDLRRM